MNRPSLVFVAGLLPLLALASVVRPMGSLSPETASVLAAPLPGTTLSDHRRAQLVQGYGRLPLAFEKNQGQTDGQVKYLARGAGYALFLTGDEAVLSLRAESGKSVIPADAEILRSEHAQAKLDSRLRGNDKQMKTAVVRARLLGASRSAKVAGEAPLPGKSNYLVGEDPRRWHTDVEQYARVRYEDVYPGVDLVYYGNQGQLEYDFVLAPHTDPARIKLAYAGADQLRLDDQGDLRIHTASGDLVQHKPLVYQTVDGQRKSIEGAFKLSRSRSGRQQVAFALGAYDRSLALTIDPVLAYSTYLGGTGNDAADAIAVDSAGNAYIAGSTTSTDFPGASTSAIQPVNTGGIDAFVAKLNASGSALVYSTYLGGTGNDFARAIAVDNGGEVYIAGDTSSTDFHTTGSATQPSNAGLSDAFVAALVADGNALIYSTYLGGSGNDRASALAVDLSGNAYVAGATTSTDFPTQTPYHAMNAGGDDAFVTKLNGDGSALLYSTYFGGTDTDQAKAIAINAAGNAFVAGTTASNNIPVALPLQGSTGGGADAFVFELTPDGQNLEYSTYLGGNGADQANAIAVNSSGDIYIAGVTSSANFPTTVGAFQTIKAAGQDAFVVKLNAAGGNPISLIYSTYLGGSDADQANAMVVDDGGNAYIAGTTTSTSFPLANAAQAANGGGTSDAFVARLDATGSTLIYSTYLGGSHFDEGFALALDSGGNAYVVGFTDSPDFPTVSPLQAVNGGNSGAFIAKLAPSPSAVQFGLASYAAGENAGTATISVLRTGSVENAVSVNFTTSDGTGTAGTHYTAASGTLTWPIGDNSTKFFVVPVKDDHTVDGDHTVNLELFWPTTAVTLGVPNTAVLTVTNTDTPSPPPPPPVPGALQFSASGYSIGEKGASVTITVDRANGADGAVSVSYATSDGSGKAGTHYTASSGTLSWASGDADPKTFSVPVLDDHSIDGNHTVNLALSSPTGGASLTAPSTAVIDIAEADTPGPVLMFALGSFSAPENAGSATIVVARTGSSTGAVSVHYASSDGSGLAGTHYTAASGTLDWANGDAAPKTFSVPVLDDGAVDGNHTVNLALSMPTGGATLGTPHLVLLTVTNTDAPAPPGTLEFGLASFSASEHDGSATITVTRQGGSAGAVSVAYASSDGSGISGTNYSAVSGTLNWADGDNSTQTFEVPIVDDGLADGAHTVSLALSSPTGGAALAAPATAVLTLSDADAPPSVAFGATGFEVSEKSKLATITVLRSVSSHGAVSVDYTTADGTGLDGTHYTATHGTLNWADGDNTARTFAVPVIDDGNTDGDHTVNLALSHPNGAALGSPSTAVLTVTEADHHHGGGALAPALLAGLAGLAGLRRRRGKPQTNA